MKKIVWSLMFLFISVSIAPALFAAMPFAPEKVIAIHIGPKNPTFDESKFPDIKFFYTPKIKYTSEKTTGKPALLAKWINDGGLRLDEAIVLDKNGTGAFKGFLMRNKNIIDALGQGDLDMLGNVLKRIFEENKESIHSTEKPMDWTSISDMLGRKFPVFEIENASGEAITTAPTSEGITYPAMIFVYRVPPDHQFKDAEAAMQDVTSPLQALGAFTGMAVTDEQLELFKKLESELYGK